MPEDSTSPDLVALFGLRAGKIATMRAYTDVTEALDAVGPSD
jgi:hypothetical protein